MSQNTSKSTSSSILASITSGVNSLANEIGKGVNRAIEEVDRAWFDATNQRFRKAFAVPPGEVLYGEFWAQCVNATQINSCTCYVSSSYFSFIVNVSGQKAQVMLPMKDIVNIQRAISLRTSTGAYAIQAATDPNFKTDALQIYTSDMKLHQFISFMQYEKAYNALMYAWNASRQAQQQPQTYPGQQGYPVPFQAPVQSVPQPYPYVSSYPNVQPSQVNTATTTTTSTTPVNLDLSAPSLSKNI